jgi:hypothetical protein
LIECSAARWNPASGCCRPRGELAQEILAGLGHHLGEHRADAVLHRGAALVGEVALQRSREVAAVRPEDRLEARLQIRGHALGLVGEARLHRARRALELRLDEVGLHAGLLTIQDAGADLDRVGHHGGRILACLRSLGHDPHGALVGHDEAVDAQAITEDADARLGERGGGFHDEGVARYPAS